MKILDFINENKDKIIDIYFDMDGVLAEYDIGNFDYESIRPINTSIMFVKSLLDYKNINIYILSICKTDNVIKQKIDWFKKYMDFFNKDNILLLSKENKDISSEEYKSNYLKENTNKDHLNIVIDDDIRIIKAIKKNNEDINVFHVSSIIK
jgi:hypothetical protein